MYTSLATYTHTHTHAHTHTHTHTHLNVILTNETRHRVPNKDEIIEVLGKLTADYTASASSTSSASCATAAAITAATSQTTKLRDASRTHSHTNTDPNPHSMRTHSGTPARVSGAHARRKSLTVGAGEGVTTIRTACWQLDNIYNI